MGAWLTYSAWWNCDQHNGVIFERFTTAMRQTDQWLEQWLQLLGAGSTDVHAPTDDQLATFDVVTYSLGRSHRAVKVQCDKFAHTVKVEEALTAAHPDLLDLQACANSAVLCARNVTVHEFSAVALRRKQQQEKDRDLEEHAIQVLESHTKVKAFNGTDVVDDEMITNEFLNMCHCPGVPHTGFSSPRAVSP